MQPAKRDRKLCGSVMCTTHLYTEKTPAKLPLCTCVRHPFTPRTQTQNCVFTRCVRVYGYMFRSTVSLSMSSSPPAASAINTSKPRLMANNRTICFPSWNASKAKAAAQSRRLFLAPDISYPKTLLKRFHPASGRLLPPSAVTKKRPEGRFICLILQSKFGCGGRI